MKSRLGEFVPGIAFIAVMLAALEFAGSYGIVNPRVFPRPSTIAATVGSLMMSGRLVGPLCDTLALLGAGYAIACVAGIGLGVLMGRYKAVFNACEPLIELLRPIPKPALLPPLMLLLGLGSELKVAIVALGAVFPILINALQGSRSVDRVYIDTARTFGYSEIRILGRVVLPAAIPMIVVGMKVSLGLGLVLVILAEMLSGSGGLGAEIVDMQRSFRITQMYAWVVILSLVGLGLAVAFNVLERRIAFWHVRAGSG